jgi:hypothetical protein
MSEAHKNQTETVETNRVFDAKSSIEANPIASSTESNPSPFEPPLWYKEQKRALRAMPPPTLEKMRTQFRASAEARRKSVDGY